MLGLDNYYGGITTTINNGKDFTLFNERMERKDDQQAGLSYQGMAHLQLHAADAVEKYRLAIMKNCNKLYEALPSKLIFYEGNTNPVQFSRIEDNRLVFLDIKSLLKARKLQSVVSAHIAPLCGERRASSDESSKLWFCHY